VAEVIALGAGRWCVVRPLEPCLRISWRQKLKDRAKYRWPRRLHMVGSQPHSSLPLTDRAEELGRRAALMLESAHSVEDDLRIRCETLGAERLVCAASMVASSDSAGVQA